MKRMLLVLLASVCPAIAFAADYGWQYAGQTYPSAVAACDAHLAVNKAINPSVLDVRVDFKTETTANCVLLNRLGNTVGSTNVGRIGDSCPDGQNYNSNIGGCEPPPPDECEETRGDTTEHEFNRGPIGDPSQRNSPPPEVCKSQCQYALTATVKTCRRFLEGGNLDDVFCTVIYEGTGTACTAGNPAPGSPFDQPPSKPPAKADPTFDKESRCDDWTTLPDGTQTRSCSSTSEKKDPGKLDCKGESCSSGVPPPKYEKEEVNKKTDKKTNPDGSTSTETSTNTKKTTCKGAEPCKSTEKDEKEKDGKDADGEDKEGDYQCTGTGCEDEGEEEETSFVGGESCDAGLSCEGDPVQCAILRKQKEQACAFEEAMNWDENKSKVDQLFQGEQYQVKEETVQIPSFVSSGTRFLPGSSCPPPRRETLRSGAQIEMSYEPMCNFAEGISPVVVGCALLFAALYVGRGMGGA